MYVTSSLRNLLILSYCLLICSSVRSQILRNEADIMQAVRRTNQMQILSLAKTNTDVDTFVSSLLEDSENNIAKRAEQVLQDGLVKENGRFNVSRPCLDQVEMLLEELISGKQWAVRSK